jgi:hypothetical protein
VTKQLIAIADHPVFLTDGINSHLAYHHFVHMTREITVKGMASEVAAGKERLHDTKPITTGIKDPFIIDDFR